MQLRVVGMLPWSLWSKATGSRRERAIDTSQRETNVESSPFLCLACLELVTGIFQVPLLSPILVYAKLAP